MGPLKSYKIDCHSPDAVLQGQLVTICAGDCDSFGQKLIQRVSTNNIPADRYDSLYEQLPTRDAENAYEQDWAARAAGHPYQ